MKLFSHFKTAFAAGQIEAHAGRDVEVGLLFVILGVVERHACSEIKESERRLLPEAALEHEIDGKGAGAVVDHHVDGRSETQHIDPGIAITEISIDINGGHIVACHVDAATGLYSPGEMSKRFRGAVGRA